MSPSLFITFEGLDGSGKSTQLGRLKEWLEAQRQPVTVTRQPGGTRIGEGIRELLLDSRTVDLSPLTELGLMFSDRAQSIVQVIRPALAKGDIVLCDRFTDSTEAYQGGGRQLGSETVLDLHRILCQGFQPDLTFLLMPDFERSLHRARLRNERHARSTGSDENRFERESTAFFRRVFDKYREIAAREVERVMVIEGDGPIEEIHQKIAGTVEMRLRMNG